MAGTARPGHYPILLALFILLVPLSQAGNTQPTTPHHLHHLHLHPHLHPNTPTPPTAPNCTDAIFAASLSRTAALAENLTQLAAALAQRPGLQPDYEHLALNISTLFTSIARQDWANRAQLAQAYGNAYQHVVGAAAAKDMGLALPCRELADVQQLLQARVAAAEFLLANRSQQLQRAPIPAHHLAALEPSPDNSSFVSRASGRPAFPGGFDQGIWRWFYGFAPDVLPQLLPLGQDGIEIGVAIDRLLPSGWGVNASEVAHIARLVDSYWQQGLRTTLVAQCSLPAWAVQSFANLSYSMGDANCGYDISHPALPRLWNATMAPVLAALNGHPGLLSFRLGNEVHFQVVGGQANMSSMYALQDWQRWLQARYGSVEALRAAWKGVVAVPASATNFSAIPWPVQSGGSSGKLELLRDVVAGTSPFWDFNRWNMDRVATYYRWLVGLVKAAAPALPTHTKFINEHFFGGYTLGGMDRAQLNRIFDWSGADTRIVSEPWVELSGPHRRPQDYALDWLDAAIGYCWMATVQPRRGRQLVVDLEMHPILISEMMKKTPALRTGVMRPGHMRATMWLSLLSGLDANMVWSWARDAQGYPTDILVDTLATLPLAMGEYAQSMAEANALGEAVLAARNGSGANVCIWSSLASRIQDSELYASALVDAFEALSFVAGLRVRFVDEEGIVEGLGGAGLGELCQRLVVPGLTHASDAAVAALGAWVSDAGSEQLLRVADAGQRDSFLKFEAETGSLRKDLPGWAGQVRTVTDAAAKTLLSTLSDWVAATGGSGLGGCVSPDRNSTSIYGLLCWAGQMATGEVAVVAVNVGLAPATFQVAVSGAQGGAVRDLLTGAPLGGGEAGGGESNATVTLDVLGVGVWGVAVDPETAPGVAV